MKKIIVMCLTFVFSLGLFLSAHADDMAARKAALAKKNELREYSQTLRGTSFSEAIKKFSEKIGDEGMKKTDRQHTWMKAEQSPYCIQAFISQDKDGKVTLANVVLVDGKRQSVPGTECMKKFSGSGN